MGFDLDFDLESEDELFCPACGKAITSRGTEGSIIKMRCRCGKILNIREQDGIAIIAAQMHANEEKGAEKRAAAYHSKLVTAAGR